MNFIHALILGLYVFSLVLYVDSLTKIFEEDKFDLLIYLLSIGLGVISYIYFALLGIDYINIIFIGLYVIMFIGSILSAKVLKRLESED